MYKTFCIHQIIKLCHLNWKEKEYQHVNLIYCEKKYFYLVNKSTKEVLSFQSKILL